MKLRHVVLSGLVILLGLLAVELVLTRGRTPPIRGPEGDVLPGSVARLERIELGGVEQTILIRGRDRSNPVLLFLHGGPGNPAMYLAHAFQRPLEKDFVVVQWDRRGAGTSYGALERVESLTVRRMLDDTHELARRLAERFDREQIYLLGHSWGSYLGLLAAWERPELYLAYVGTGQMAAGPEEVDRARRRGLADRARAAGDTAVARAFATGERAAGEKALFAYGAELRGATSFWPLLWTGLRAPEYTLVDALNVRRGIQRSGAHMQRNVIRGTLDEEVRRLRVPVAFFLGRHDLNTPSDLAAAYLDRLDAPLKRLVWFEEAAHFPFLTRPERFHRALEDFHVDVVEHGRSVEGEAPTPRP